MSLNTLSIFNLIWEAGYIHSQGCCTGGPSRRTEILTWKVPASFHDLLGLALVILTEVCPLTQISQWSHLCRNSWPTQGINVPSAHRHSPDAHTHCSCNSGSWFEGHHVSHPYCKLCHSCTWSQQWRGCSWNTVPISGLPVQGGYWESGKDTQKG